MVAITDNKIAESFYGEILNDEVLQNEQDSYKEVEVIRKFNNTIVQRNYLQIKQDIQYIIQFEMDINDLGLAHLVIKKGK